MLRSVATASAGLVTLVVSIIAPESAAHALGYEYLSCSVGPANSGNYTSPTCRNSSSGTLSYYEADFLVQNETGSSSYSWSIPGAYPIAAGCTSTTNYCHINMENTDARVTVSVTLTQNGSAETLQATAVVLQTCGSAYC